MLNKVYISHGCGLKNSPSSKRFREKISKMI